MNKTISFCVSEVFGHRVAGFIPQFMGDIYTDVVFVPNQHKTLVVPKSIQKLVDYKLLKKMNDTAIQAETNSTPMDEEAFLIVLYLLIIKPELGKELLGYELRKYTVYIFHVKITDSTLRTVSVHWRGDGWDCCAASFGEGRDWRAGNVFIHFATV